MTNERKCYACGRATDTSLDKRGMMKVELRPYGPNGAYVCFECAMAPARKAETERNFGARLKACAVPIIGTDAGVFEGKDLVRKSGRGS